MRSWIILIPLCMTAIAVWAENPIALWVSAQDNSRQMASDPPLQWTGEGKPDIPTLTIDPTITYQKMLGLGSSWEHATCENLYKLPEAERFEVIKRVVHPEEGIGMNLMRLCIGASDFIGEPYYTYDDMPPGETDPDLDNFSIAKDRAYLIPVIKKSMEYNPNLLFFASPWSPPGWMKTTGKLEGGRLKPEYYGVYAQYLMKYIQAYAAEGIPIYAITVQNEPHMVDLKYPTTLWTGEEQRDFIRDHLGPLFKANNMDTLIWCWDHNWNKIEFPRTVLSDAEAAQYVDGTAFHLYEGTVEAQTELKNEFPDKHIYFSEGSVFRVSGAVRLVNILRHESRSYNAWVTLLDEHRKPNRGPHSASATAIELKDDRTVEYRCDYYIYGQFMKFIQRDALRIDSTDLNERHVANVAFQNPDGTIVLIAANAGRTEREMNVFCQGKTFILPLSSSTVVTCRWMP